MHRLRPYHLALCVLLVGWTPSFLLAYYSYTVLGRAVESKIVADDRDLVGSLSQHVENELERTGETLDYYQTLPATVSLLQPPAAPAAVPVAPAVPAGTPPPPAHRRPGPGLPRTGGAVALPPAPAPTTTPAPTAQELLATIFYPQRRIDGLFLTDDSGHLLAALPPASTDESTRTFDSPWKEAAEQSKAPFYVSPAYARAADGRLVTSVVVTVRGKDGNPLGFLGADILIERLGKRLHAVQMDTGGQTMVQVVDGTGRALFGADYQLLPATADNGISAGLRHAIHSYKHNAKNDVKEENGQLYFFSAILPTDWTIMLERPAALVHQPVQDLLYRTAFNVGLLVLGVAALAVFISSLYRRQLQSSLRMEREQIFNEKILANMPVGIALVEPAGESFLQVNSAFTEIVRSLGHLPRDVYVDRATFAQVAIASREALARVLHFGVPFQAIEQRVLTAIGQVRFLTTNLLRLQDSQQRTLGVLCLVEDTTAAVTLRQELINANTAKDQFLAQLSHELRNPLSPVITMVAELESMAETVPEARQPLEIIRRNVELEARLIDDLLDVTRISSGKLQLNRRVTDVRRTLRLALEICQRDIEDKKLRVEVDFRAREHYAEADPARLQQIFWNLIKNAVKFTPEDRRITIRAANITAGAARLNASQTHVAFASPNRVDSPAPAPREPAAPGPAGTSIRLDFIDEGIGIEPQHLRRIFNAFDQGQSSITQRFGGLGLGLAISKAMVEAHGGTLTVSSEGANRGATFTVELAVCPAPAAEAPAPGASPTAAVSPLPSANGQAPALPAPDGQGRRVLLVDDHHDTCLGMQRLLNRRGYQVTVAHSVAEGLAKAGNGETFDLLISDIGLPDGTGFELMETLRGRGGPPGIALSGYGMEADLNKSAQAGFSEHLIKPVTIDRLEAAMQRLFAAETKGP